jgi:4-diphosphocytidyl-2-C-methyl-D-erythritol kinase
MGAGLGGGSSNAAAVLLALPALAGLKIPPGELHALAAQLGSDVPFFLYGGTALGLGRGTELYPLPDLPAIPGLLIVSGVHSSTAEAYRALGRSLTISGYEPDTSGFQSLVWGMGQSGNSTLFGGAPLNDFESVVFNRHPQLAAIRDRLRQCGARPAMMTGSGSAVFGLFDSRQHAAAAAALWKRRQEAAAPLAFRFVSRPRFRALWLHHLRDHARESIWPPQSRYSKK